MGRSLPSNSHLTESIISTVADETDWHDLVRNQSTVACDGNATAANCSLQPSVPTKIAGVQLQYHLLFLLIFPVITVFGNVLVSMSVYRERSLQTVTNYFIVSLAISDIMVAVLVMPFAVYVEVNNGEWRLGDALCDTWVAFDVLCCTASILNLTAISVDRFIAVTLPIQYAKHRNSKRVMVMLSLTWVLSVAISSPIALGINYTDRRSQTPTLCTFYNSDFLIFSSMGSFYIPCFAMLLLYWGIFRTIRRRVRKLNMAASGGRASDLTTKGLLAARRRDGKQPRFGDEPSIGCDVTRRTSLFPRNRNANRARVPPDIRLLTEPETGGAPALDTANTEGEDLVPVEEASAGELRSPTTPESLQTPSVYCSSDRPNGGSTSLSSTFTISSSAGCLVPSPQTLPPPSDALLTYLPNPASTITTNPASPSRQRTMDKFTVNLCKKLSKATKCERKAIKTLAIVVGVFLICWMPFFTINIINAICIRTDVFNDSPSSAAAAAASSPSSSSSSSSPAAETEATVMSVVAASICHIHPMMFSFFVWLGYINSFINPVIYTLFNIEFRRAFNKILREMCKANN